MGIDTACFPVIPNAPVFNRIRFHMDSSFPLRWQHFSCRGNCGGLLRSVPGKVFPREFIRMVHAFSPSMLPPAGSRVSLHPQRNRTPCAFQPCAVAVCPRRTFRVPRCFHVLPAAVPPISGRMPEKNVSCIRHSLSRTGQIGTEKKLRIPRPGIASPLSAAEAHDNCQSSINSYRPLPCLFSISWDIMDLTKALKSEQENRRHGR